MYNTQDTAVAIKNYLFKLKKLIESDTLFTFGGIKVINKAKIDDILCCVEGSLPQEYRDYLKKYGGIKLKSKYYLNQLHVAIKNRFLFSSTNYAVRVKDAEQMINSIIHVIESDLDKIMEEL